MSAIHDPIEQFDDPCLRGRLAFEWANASKEKQFELVFEHRLSEMLPLHSANRIAKGCTIQAWVMRVDRLHSGGNGSRIPVESRAA